MKRWGALALTIGLFLCAPAMAQESDQAARAIDQLAAKRDWQIRQVQCVQQADPICVVKFNSRHRRGCLRRYHFNEDGARSLRPSIRPLCRKKPYKGQSIPNWLWSVET